MIRCKALSKQRGEQCRNAVVPGLEVCRFHGGATKRAKAKSERIQAEEKTRSRVGRSRFKGTENVDPMEILQVILDRTWTEVRAYDALIRKADDQERVVLFGQRERAMDRAVKLSSHLSSRDFREAEVKKLAAQSEAVEAILVASVGMIVRDLFCIPESGRDPLDVLDDTAIGSYVRKVFAFHLRSADPKARGELRRPRPPKLPAVPDRIAAELERPVVRRRAEPVPADPPATKTAPPAVVGENVVPLSAEGKRRRAEQQFRGGMRNQQEHIERARSRIRARGSR